MTTLKRKVHWNLSGSHHTLDSDNAFIGGAVYVTGSVSASVGVSASAGFQAGAASTFKAATFGGFVSASNYLATANNLQVGQNAFVTGSLQVTGSLRASGSAYFGNASSDVVISTAQFTGSNGISGSLVQGTTLLGQQVTASYLSGSATEYFGTTAGNLAGALVVQSPMFLSGTEVSSAFGATDLQFVVGLKDNNYVFGVDSGSISWSSGSGFKIVPSSTPGEIELWANGQNLLGGGGGGGGGGGTVYLTASVNLPSNDGGPRSGSLVFYRSDQGSPAFQFGGSELFSDSRGVAKFTMNTLARVNVGEDTGTVSWTHIVTYVSDSAGGIRSTGFLETDYITSSVGAASVSDFDINLYSESNNLVFAITGSTDGAEFVSDIVNGFAYTGGGIKRFIA